MIKLTNLTWVDPLGKLIGEWSATINIYSILLRIALAILFGALIGCERSSKRHSAGLRTFILVTLMGALAAILDTSLLKENGTALYLFSAITILGTVTIGGNSILFSSKKQIKGLTTSTGLWLCVMLGLVIGLGYYLVAIILCAMLLLVLAIFPAIEFFLKNRSNHFEIHLELNDKSKLQDFTFTLRKLHMRIDDIEMNNAYIGSGLSVYTISMTDEEKKARKHEDIIEALATLKYVYHVEEIQ